jgi:hypothetical protein
LLYVLTYNDKSVRLREGRDNRFGSDGHLYNDRDVTQV